MKIAISAQGTTLDSPADSRVGRARYFVVVDTDSDQFSAHDNMMNLNAAQGAGIQAAKNVSDLGVRAVVTGNVGPKAHAALSAAGIEMYTGASGTVRDALQAFRAGALSRADRANVEGHWM
ncbi:MAG: NifB/NifX family molybdenum-iron cluster-binding protein [Candidatus Latescibacterota bacterium]